MVMSKVLGSNTVSRLAGIEEHPHAAAVLGGALPPDGAPSHAYLFEGPAGSGKDEVAREFAALLLSDGAADPASAAARARSGAHPDLTWVAPTSSAGLLVGDIDQPIVAAASRTPFESRRRVFVIESADSLNDQAANRMLKTLEEPPDFAHLILLTERPGKMLATIASRCQRVRFDAPSTEQIAARLGRHGIAPEPAEACARLGLGDFNRALALGLGDGPALRAGAEGFARAALRDRLADQPWLVLLRRSNDLAQSAYDAVEAKTAEETELVPKKERKRVEREGAERGKRAQRRAKQAALDHGLELTGLWLRDVACVAAGAPELVHNTDRTAALAEDAEGRSPARLRTGQELVEETRRRLDLNVGEELALEQLAFRLARAVAA
jgi:DNA polymerase-3 subunit delta'